MAAASYYHGNTNSKSDFTTESYALQSPDPSYNSLNTSPNPSHSRPYTSQHEYLNPAVHAPSGTGPSTSQSGTQITRKDPSKLQRLKRHLRVLTVAAQAFSTLTTLAIFGIMVFVNYKFYTTKDTIREQRTPWPKDGTKTWPSIMMLAAAGTTLLLSIVVLLGYCCCWKRTTTSWVFTVFRYVVQIVAWITIAVIYRYEKSLHGVDNDMWGWSCSTKANAIQEAFDGVIDFPTLCSAQGSSWSISIVEFVVKMIFALGHFYLYRKKEALAKRDFADGVGDATTGFLPYIINQT